MNERRYEDILETSRVPIWGLFKESIKEDKLFLMPRVLRETFGTLVRMPHSILMKAGPRQERFVFEVLESWGKKTCKLSQIKLKTMGKEKIDPDGTYLFVSNHRSPVDIPALYATLPVPAGFVANATFSWLPVFSYWMRKSGAVFVELGNRAVEASAFRTMVRRLKRGRSLVLFPEGYIQQGKGLAEFKRGGIHSAILAHVPIVPVSLSGTDDVMRPGGLRIVPRKTVVVQYGTPIDVNRLSSSEKRNIESILRDKIAAMLA
jgi:1-acyl-sn-glycerol-3-phosphate acyltransferase